MAERSKAQHWKCCVGETLPWVRIPLSPPFSFPPPDSTKKVNPFVVLLKGATVVALTHSEQLCVRHTQNHVGASTPDDFADQF